ncbi:MerR family transcriptional regulator [Romboutsia ilealis]|uniref:MerR family transcriptional regulator n=1 Tax=Romboutsia ilealis TaxID=1115758 RepID=UPI002731F91D|nr:MerR family transcriptional regulator [Romboutsia ilealis]
MYKINEVSKLTGVSIRMLHHYDKIKLLEPSKRTDSNYRMYNDDDIARLYQILLFKELEFPLQEIKQILDNKDFDRAKALKLQRNLIFEKKKRLERILESIDDTIENLGGKTMSKNNFKAFDYEGVKKHQEKYKEETEKRYGKSDTYKESQEKTSKYSKNDWNDIIKEANLIYIELAKSDEKVQELIEKWRNHITTNFYNCTIEIFRGLALMYIGDERFTKNIDKYGEGLAKFMSDGMNIYCDNNVK